MSNFENSRNFHHDLYCDVAEIHVEVVVTKLSTEAELFEQNVQDLLFEFADRVADEIHERCACDDD